MNIRKLNSPQAVRAAIEEFDKVGRTYFLEKYGFGRSREYMLRDTATGKLYDSKAIIGAAFGYAFPDDGPLKAEDFSGGEATVERVLSEMGFEVVRVGQDWTREEVEATVKDYFETLRLEAAGISYSKTKHNERLRSKLTARSKASIELKHQNISAILDQLGLPYLRGYKPRSNLQDLLRRTVLDFVGRNQNALESVMASFDAQTTPGAQEFRVVLIEPPKVEPATFRLKRSPGSSKSRSRQRISSCGLQHRHQRWLGRRPDSAAFTCPFDPSLSWRSARSARRRALDHS